MLKKQMRLWKTSCTCLSNNLRMIIIQEDMSHLFENNNSLVKRREPYIPADSFPFLGNEEEFP